MSLLLIIKKETRHHLVSFFTLLFQRAFDHKFSKVVTVKIKKRIFLKVLN